MPRLFYLVALSLIVFSILTVFAAIPAEYDFFKDADEEYYFRYANAILKNGLKEFPILLKWYVENKEAQIHPNPMRVGYLLAAVLSFKTFGAIFSSLAYLSFFSFLLFLFVSFYFSKKYFGKDIALLYTLLLSSSPLMMAMARRALSDSFGNLFWGFVIWLLFDFLIQKNRIQYILFLLLCAFCIMIRESSIILVLFFALFFCLYKYIYKKDISNIYLWGIIFIPILKFTSLRFKLLIMITLLLLCKMLLLHQRHIRPRRLERL